jgi:hypothetical protein
LEPEKELDTIPSVQTTASWSFTEGTRAALPKLLGGSTQFCRANYGFLHDIDHMLAFFGFVHMAFIVAGVERPGLTEASKWAQVYRLLSAALIISLVFLTGGVVSGLGVGVVCIFACAVWFHHWFFGSAASDTVQSTSCMALGLQVAFLPYWTRVGRCIVELFCVLAFFELGQNRVGLQDEVDYGDLHSTWHVVTALWASRLLWRSKYDECTSSDGETLSTDQAAESINEPDIAGAPDVSAPAVPVIQCVFLLVPALGFIGGIGTLIAYGVMRDGEAAWPTVSAAAARPPGALIFEAFLLPAGMLNVVVWGIIYETRWLRTEFSPMGLMGHETNPMSSSRYAIQMPHARRAAEVGSGLFQSTRVHISSIVLGFFASAFLVSLCVFREDAHLQLHTGLSLGFFFSAVLAVVLQTLDEQQQCASSYPSMSASRFRSVLAIVEALAGISLACFYFQVSRQDEHYVPSWQLSLYAFSEYCTMSSYLLYVASWFGEVHRLVEAMRPGDDTVATAKKLRQRPPQPYRHALPERSPDGETLSDGAQKSSD